MSGVHILEGDFRPLLEQMADESVDCVLVDPPYARTSLPWDDHVPGWPRAVKRILKSTGSMWCFGTLRYFMAFVGEFSGWRVSQDVVWEKHNGTGLFNDRFRNVHEQAVHFYKEGAKWADVYKCTQKTMDATKRTVRKKGRPAHWIGATGETTYVSEDGGPRLARSVMYCRSEHGHALHPTQKPIEIVLPLLKYACPPGGVVLDIFAGSGTTGAAAFEAGMTAVLIEANPQYVQVMKERLRDAILPRP